MMKIVEDARRYIIPRRKFGSDIGYVLLNTVMLFFQEGFIAILLHRFVELMRRAGIGKLGFIVAKIGLFFTGIYINPEARIGGGCKLNHSGTTIRAESIGKNAEITGSITIGEREPFSDFCPRIGDNVYIGTGARVLANVGSNVVIGANAVVTRDIPDNCIAGGIPARVIGKNESKEI